MKEEIWKYAQEIKEEIISIRRQIHMYPEVGYEEEKTSSLVIEKLKKMGIEYQANVAKYGIVAFIKGGNPQGPTIGIRADMDALALQEESSASYKSKIDGRCHACGHDAHTAMLLGVAKILTQIKKKINGNVKLFFQPAEEGIGGAKRMVAEGALKNPAVSAVLALHVADDVPAGKIQFKDGSFTASTDDFKIEIVGKGGHAAYPHETIDPIIVGSHIVSAVQTISSRYTSPLDPVVVSITTFNAGSAYNIIPEKAYLSGTIRALKQDVREKTYLHFKRIIEEIGQAFGAKITIELIVGYSPGSNNPDLNAIIIAAAKEIIGEKNIQKQDLPEMGAEDFYEFSEGYKIPVAMFWLGIRNEAKGIVHQAHSSKFDIDEDTLPLGSAILTYAAIKYLEKFPSKINKN